MTALRDRLNGACHLWLAWRPPSPPPATVREWSALLSPDEQSAANRMGVEARREGFLFRRALRRVVLSRYAALGPSDWRFASSPGGRPVVEPNLKAECHLHFSASASGQLTACLVGLDSSLGVDVEQPDQPGRDPLLAAQFLAPLERRWMDGAAPSLRLTRFLTLWALHEARLKARGLGLELRPPQVAFQVDDSAGSAAAEGENGWRFRQASVRGHLVATALGGPTPREILWTQSDGLPSDPVVLTPFAPSP